MNLNDETVRYVLLSELRSPDEASFKLDQEVGDRYRFSIQLPSTRSNSVLLEHRNAIIKVNKCGQLNVRYSKLDTKQWATFLNDPAFQAKIPGLCLEEVTALIEKWAQQS